MTHHKTMNIQFKNTLIFTALFGIIFVLFFALGDALIPLLLAFFMAYLLFPLIIKLERRGLNRNASIFILFTLIFGAVAGASVLVIPSLISDGKELVEKMPALTVKAVQKVELIGDGLGIDLDLSRNAIEGHVREHLGAVIDGVRSWGSKILGHTFSGITNWILAILNLFLIPLFFFYLVNDFEKISGEIKSLIPRNLLPKLEHYAGLSNRALSGYIRGQLMVAFCLAILYAIGLFAVGLKFGLLIGIISGLISIIPYAGLMLGFITAVIVALANYTGPGVLIGLSLVFIIVQALEGTIITPKLVGDKVGLSSLATMLALIVGGNLFGVVGMLLAIPCASILKSILADLKEEYIKSELYK